MKTGTIVTLFLLVILLLAATGPPSSAKYCRCVSVGNNRIICPCGGINSSYQGFRHQIRDYSKGTNRWKVVVTIYRLKPDKGCIFTGIGAGHYARICATGCPTIY